VKKPENTMLFEKDQWKEFLQGADHLEEEDGFVFLRRFTSGQIEMYRSDERFVRCLASAGIRLDVETDAEMVSFEVLFKQGSGLNSYALEICADGREIAAFSGLTENDPRLSVREELAPGTKQLRIYFPNLAQCGIRHLEFAGASFVRPVRREKKLLLLGDSITQGYTADKSRGSYANRLADALGFELFNLGYGGEIFHPALLERPPAVRPDAVLIAYGTNDWSVRSSRSLFEQDVEAFLDRTAALWPEAFRVLMTPLWRTDWQNNVPIGLRFGELRHYLEKEADRRGFFVIPGEEILPPDPAYMSDHVHPNSAGFEVIARELFRRIKNITESE